MSAAVSETDPHAEGAPAARQSRIEERRLAQALVTHFADVWRSLRRFGVPVSSADDAAQQVFSVFAQRMAQVELERERAFLVGVSVRVAANFSRKQRRSREIASGSGDDAPSPIADPEKILMQKQRLEQLDRALNSLPEEQRVVFALYEIAGFSLPEVAHTLGLKLGTATSRLARARARFETWVDENLAGHHD